MKKKTTATQGEGWHLVLGGSGGIGFAFAKWLAQRRCRLVVVSRHLKALNSARDRLLAVGAPEVMTIAGNLLEHTFRSKMYRQLARLEISTVFVGGPSPPSGELHTVSDKDISGACECCLAYPLEIMQFLDKHRQRLPKRLILLSSSASKESLASHPFYLSAIFRRMAETMLNSYARENGGRISVNVWRPRVVYTRLAKQYAQTLEPLPHGDSLPARLQIAFNSRRIPTPDTFVCQAIIRTPLLHEI